MKRVYVIFEDRHEGGGPFLEEYEPLKWYENKFVDVYDNLPAAIESIRQWADCQQNVAYRNSGKASEELAILDRTCPYNNDTQIFMARVVKSTLLKSS